MLRQSTAILAVLSLVGCAQLDGPVALQALPVAFMSASGSGLVSRPWKGGCEGTATFVDAVTLHIVATCQLAHLGMTTVVATETVVPRPDGRSDLNSVNTYTAANGDILRTVGAGIATLKPDFSGVTFAGTETAVGGTGRFSNASGVASRIGSTRFSDSSGSYEHEGMLTYDPSDRQ